MQAIVRKAPPPILINKLARLKGELKALTTIPATTTNKHITAILHTINRTNTTAHINNTMIRTTRPMATRTTSRSTESNTNTAPSKLGKATLQNKRMIKPTLTTLNFMAMPTP